MTFIQRLRFLFSRHAALPAPVTSSIVGTPALGDKPLTEQPESEPVLAHTLFAFSKPEPLPDWLLDDESVRDEGVLFGLSNARPDGKIAEIRAAFAQQAAPLDEFIGHHTETIGELTLSIGQREDQITSLRSQLIELRQNQPLPNNLIRTVVSLCLSVVMCIGNFYLIDETLRPSFPNRWIAVGVFLAGMFNLFGRTSFFYETDSQVLGRRIIEEVGLPLATSGFVLMQALQTQSVGSAIGLFVFVFFLFLLAGKLLLNTLTAWQNDLGALEKNRQLLVRKEQDLPVWTREVERLEREIDAIRAQKWPIITALNQAEADLNQSNTRRDRLVHVFMSEFELARSLRERLTEQQREGIFN